MAHPYDPFQLYYGVTHPAYRQMTGNPETIFLVHGDRTRVVAKPQSYNKLTELAREIFAVDNAEFLMSFWFYNGGHFTDAELDPSAYHLVVNKSCIRCVWKSRPNGNTNITTATIREATIHHRQAFEDVRATISVDIAEAKYADPVNRARFAAARMAFKLRETSGHKGKQALCNLSTLAEDLESAFVALSHRGVGMPASSDLDVIEAKKHATGMTSSSSSPYTEDLTEIRDALHTACQALRPLLKLSKVTQLCKCSSISTRMRQFCAYCVPLHPTVTYNRRSKKAASIRKIQQNVTKIAQDLIKMQYIAAWEIPLLEMVDPPSDTSSSVSDDRKLRLSKAKGGKAVVCSSKKISNKSKVNNDWITSSSSGTNSE